VIARNHFKTAATNEQREAVGSYSQPNALKQPLKAFLAFS